VDCWWRHASLGMNVQVSILMAQTTDPSSWHYRLALVGYVTAATSGC
jgi:hypothetical protein